LLPASFAASSPGGELTEEKIRENRVRRMAERQDCRLEKSRRRDPNAVDYGGYMLISNPKNTVILGGSPRPYMASLDDVEAWLTRGGKRKNAKK
jgi:hypothetical protein